MAKHPLQFFLVAIAIFFVIKLMNHMTRRQKPPPPAPGPEIELLKEIRDLLKRDPAPAAENAPSKELGAGG